MGEGSPGNGGDRVKAVELPGGHIQQYGTVFGSLEDDPFTGRIAVTAAASSVSVARHAPNAARCKPGICQVRISH